jgi:hypothetical protein
MIFGLGMLIMMPFFIWRSRIALVQPDVIWFHGRGALTWIDPRVAIAIEVLLMVLGAWALIDGYRKCNKH